MKSTSTIGAAAAACCLAACGGGGGDSATSPATSGTTTYAFVTPTVGARDTFTTTTVDDSNNTITGGYEETVASVASDGSYTLSQVDPSGASVTVNGLLYRFDPRVTSFDASGHEMAIEITRPTGVVDCTLATQAGGHVVPWYVGQAWTQSLTESCSPGASIAYALVGQVTSYESVTVPAGTFMALKVVSTQTWTDPTGQTVVETITHWADPAHSLFTLKTIYSLARSGTVPAHYTVSETIELASRGQ